MGGSLRGKCDEPLSTFDPHECLQRLTDKRSHFLGPGQGLCSLHVIVETNSSAIKNLALKVARQ